MKKLLVVVDFQNDFVSGALGFEGADKLDKGIASKIRKYGKGNVIFTRDTHYDDYLQTREGKNLPVTHCIKDSTGYQIYGETAAALKEANAIGFDKTSFGLKIDEHIRSMLPPSVDEIEIVGLVSNICVISNAVIFQTEYPSANIIVDASLTDSFDKELHYKTLDILQGLQVNVINRDL